MITRRDDEQFIDKTCPHYWDEIRYLLPSMQKLKVGLRVLALDYLNVVLDQIWRIVDI